MSDNYKQRFVMVKVTGCANCGEPYYDESYGAYGCGFNDAMGKEFATYKQNQYAITPTCPMYPQSQEADK